MPGKDRPFSTRGMVGILARKRSMIACSACGASAAAGTTGNGGGSCLISGSDGAGAATLNAAATASSARAGREGDRVANDRSIRRISRTAMPKAMSNSPPTAAMVPGVRISVWKAPSRGIKPVPMSTSPAAVVTTPKSNKTIGIPPVPPLRSDAV